jgi:hypothetical protein
MPPILRLLSMQQRLLEGSITILNLLLKNISQLVKVSVYRTISKKMDHPPWTKFLKCERSSIIIKKDSGVLITYTILGQLAKQKGGEASPLH